MSLKSLLVKSEKIVIRMIVAIAILLSAWPISNMFLGTEGTQRANWKAIIIGIGVVFYLIYTVKRLSSERQHE